MPVRLSPGTPAHHEARIEIVPLIDIMFFLLAAFMLLSLSMVRMNTLRVDLPDAARAGSSSPADVTWIAVDAAGQAHLGHDPLTDPELARALGSIHATNATARVTISGDRNCRHGDLVRILDLVRNSGIAHVAIETRTGTP